MRAVRYLLAAVAIAAAGACGPTEITVADLEGAWDATTYVYLNQANPSETVDLIVTQGASMTLTVAADGTTSSVFDDGVGNTSSDSGQFTAEGLTLTLAGIAYEASVDGDLLTLVNSNAAFDFDSDGSTEPATLTITLVRR